MTKPKILAQFFGALGIVIFGASCHTVQVANERGGHVATSLLPVIQEKGITSADWDSAVLLGVEFVDPPKVSECRLRLRHVEAEEDAILSLQPTQSSVSQTLAPGRYRPVRLSCGLMRVWNLDHLYPQGFIVLPDQVSYVGFIRFRFLSNELDSIEQVGRSTNAEFLRSFLGEAQAFDVVSAFSGRSITAAMLEAPHPNHLDVRAYGISDVQKVLSPLFNVMRDCGRQGAKDDPLRLGSFLFRAKYIDGKFIEFIKEQDQSAIQNDFLSCIKTALVSFRPGIRKEFEVEVLF